MPEVTTTPEVKTTLENLQAAINGEAYEVSTMYPDFIKVAKTEKQTKAEISFNWAFDTEKKHHDFYEKVIESINTGTENEFPGEFAVCPVCGNTYDKTSTDNKCAFCQTNKEKYIWI